MFPRLRRLQPHAKVPHAARRAPPAGNAPLGPLLALLVACSPFGCGLAVTQDLTVAAGGSVSGGQSSNAGSDDPEVVPVDSEGPDGLMLTGSLGPDAVARFVSRASMPAAGKAAATRTLQVSCSTTTAPPSTARAAVNANGSFALRLPGGKDVLVGCALLDDANALLANFTFQGGGKGLEGNDRMAHEVGFARDANFGRVYWDDSTFEVAVNTDNTAAAQSPTSGDAGFNVAGTWKVRAVDFSPPAGTELACAASTSPAACTSGLREGDTWLLRRYLGVARAGGNLVQVLQAWNNLDQGQQCGDLVGLSPADAQAAGLDFSASGLSGGALLYSPALSWKNALKANATSNSAVEAEFQLTGEARSAQEVDPCYPYEMSSPVYGKVKVQGWACGPDWAGRFRFSGGTGCRSVDGGVPSDGNAYTAADWNLAVARKQCDSADAGGGLVASTCTFAAAKGQPAQRCDIVTGDYRIAAVGATPVQSPTPYSAANVTHLLAAQGLCSDLPPGSQPGATLRRSCFATYLAASAALEAPSACLPQIAVNAADGNAATQLVRDFRPRALRHADLLQVLPGATQATLSSRKTAYLAAWIPNLYFGSVPLSCPVVATRSLSVVRVSPARLLVTVTEQVGSDDLRPACLANFNNGARRSVAYLDKD